MLLRPNDLGSLVDEMRLQRRNWSRTLSGLGVRGMRASYNPRDEGCVTRLCGLSWLLFLPCQSSAAASRFKQIGGLDTPQTGVTISAVCQKSYYLSIKKAKYAYM